MKNEVNNQIEIVDLSANDTAADVGVELSAVELQAVSGGMKRSWSCGHPVQADEWTI